MRRPGGGVPLPVVTGRKGTPGAGRESIDRVEGALYIPTGGNSRLQAADHMDGVRSAGDRALRKRRDDG